ncbi:MAG: hypothetical protein IKH30_00080 [Clostridia bacterium]|nr:hypothetical protein [Clostridia bacterium]
MMEDELVEKMLDDADKAAEECRERYSFDEVFERAKKRIQEHKKSTVNKCNNE